MKIKFSIRPDYLPLWETNVRYYIVMGGRGAGRSTAVSQYVASRIPLKEYFRCALMRSIHSDIRHSSWRELNDRINEQDDSVRGALHITDNDMHIDYGENSVQAHGFRASSGSHSAKLKSIASYNTIWIEEADEVGEQEFMTLDDSLRTVKGNIKVILTLNSPHKEHWIIKRWFDLSPSGVTNFYVPKLKEGIKDTIFISGTFEDNLVNLDEHTIARYRAYEKTDPEHFYQKIKGLVAETVRGKIYSNWKEIDEVPHEARLVAYGLDFGFNPDPAGLLSVYYYNGGYILDEELYQTDLLNRHLGTYILNKPKAPVFADSAEPKSIAELKEMGIDIIPCVKGPDSVRFGIKKVQAQQISYTKRSVNLKREYENAHWKVNKDGELFEVVDPNCDDHLLDPARYVLTSILPDDPLKEKEIQRNVMENQRDRESRIKEDAGL